MKKLKMSHNVRMKFDRLYNGSQRHTGRRLSPTIQMIHLIVPHHVRRSGVTAWLPVLKHSSVGRAATLRVSGSIPDVPIPVYL